MVFFFFDVYQLRANMDRHLWSSCSSHRRYPTTTTPPLFVPFFFMVMTVIEMVVVVVVVVVVGEMTFFIPVHAPSRRRALCPGSEASRIISPARS